MQTKSIDSASAQQWAEQEFGHARLGDERLSKRLARIAGCFLEQPERSIPQACGGSWPEMKAAYRFFDNEGVDPQAILGSHYEQTQQRMAAQDLVFVIQDTTGLNFDSHPHTQGLGCIGTTAQGARGLWLHSSLAVSAKKMPLGLVKVETWVRDPKDFGVAKTRHQRKIHAKESHRWLASFAATVELAPRLPTTRLINLADREGDIYELFALAAAHPEVGVLVRARHNRAVLGSGERWDEHLRRLAPAGEIEITVPRRTGQPSRKARLELRYFECELKAPSGKHQVPVRVWVVEAREKNSPVQAPIRWRLVTNQPVVDLAGAVEKIQWYTIRWQIEEFHRVLKSGCQAEQRQLETLDRLLRVLALDLVVASKILALSRCARENPGGDPREVLAEEEVEVLRMYRQEKGKKEPLDLKQAIRTIAGLGGFIGRKGDGDPGAMTLWRGYQELKMMVAGWKLCKKYG